MITLNDINIWYLEDCILDRKTAYIFKSAITEESFVSKVRSGWPGAKLAFIVKPKNK